MTTLGTVTLGLLLAGLPALPQDPAKDAADRLSKCLRKLSSDDFQERQAASAELADLPAEAVALIEAELKNGSHEVEVRSRLEAALPKLRLKARREAVRRKKEHLQAWVRKEVLDAFDKNGQKDGRWDHQAREGLELAVQSWSGVRQDEGSMAPRAYSLLSDAVAAGCEDPMLLFARARMYDVGVKKDFNESLKLHLAAATAMKARGSVYAPYRQSAAFWRVADYLSRAKKTLSDKERDECTAWLEMAVGQLRLAAKDPAAPLLPLIDLGSGMTTTWKTLTKDRKDGMDKVLAAFSDARPQGILPLVYKGEELIHYAWDARGGGWANTVTDEGWKLMGERLAGAEAALTKAWEMDPGDPQAPTLMLKVELGQGKGRPVMETWFKRAMEADPDNHDACKKKMYYLEPKWHGSPEEMITFGRELVAGGNFEARLPFGLTDAHVNLAGYEDTPKARLDYYKKPDVWKDVQSVYEPYLKLHPNSAFDRSWYAKLACLCGQFTVADAQFQILGGKAQASVFGTRAEMERMRAEAAEKGR